LEASDADLIRQCLADDNNGFDLLVKRYQKRIIGFCYKMLGNADQASDAAQDTFVKAYYALDRFKLDAAFLPWILRIASNTCTDMLRSRARQADSLDEIPADIGPIAPEEDTPEQKMLVSENERLTREALMSLPERNRTVLVMFYFNRLSIKEISKILDKPVGSIKYDLHTAREALRRRLKGMMVGV
jgi:RNA polymerase sigma-70 factor (ECF subfamily)